MPLKSQMIADDEIFGGFSEPTPRKPGDAIPGGLFDANAPALPPGYANGGGIPGGSLDPNPPALPPTAVDGGVVPVDAGGIPGGLLDANPPPLPPGTLPGTTPGTETAALEFDPVTGRPITGEDPNLPPTQHYYGPPTARPGYVDPWQPADAPARHPRWEGFGQEEFETSPIYDFLLSEGEKGIRRDQNRGAGLHSGATIKELERFRTDLAGTEFDRARRQKFEDYATEGLEFDKGRLRGAQDRADFDKDYRQSLDIEEGKRSRYREEYMMNAANMDDYWNKLSSLAGTGQQTTSNLIQTGRQFLSEMAGAKIGGAAALGRGAIGAAEAGGGGPGSGLEKILGSIGLVGSVLGGIFGWGKD